MWLNSWVWLQKYRLCLRLSIRQCHFLGGQTIPSDCRTSGCVWGDTVWELPRMKWHCSGFLLVHLFLPTNHHSTIAEPSSLPPPAVCDSPNHAAHYPIFSLQVSGFVSDVALSWLRSKKFKFKNLLLFYFLEEFCGEYKLKFWPLALTYFRKLAECSGDRISVYLQLDSNKMDVDVPRIMLELFPKEAYTGGEWISDCFSVVMLFIYLFLPVLFRK